MADPKWPARLFMGSDLFRNSIASQMFLAVFLIYLAISLTITSAQIVEIYIRAKNDLSRELQILGSSFEGSLAKALWEFDEESLKSSIQGLQDIPGVLGVRVLDINTDVIHGTDSGFLVGQTEQGGVDRNAQRLKSRDQDYAYNLIQQDFEVFFDINGRQELVGRVTVYSNSDVVIKRIKYSVLIVILSEAIEIIAMWVIFLWVSRKMLGQPLAVLTAAAERLSKEDLKDFKVDIQAKSQNELKLLEEAFNLSAEKLYEAKDELENRMRLALSAGRIATWVWHPVDDILEFDDHLPGIFGQVPENFGHSFRDLQQFIHKDDKAIFVELMKASVSRRQPLLTDFRVNAPGGAILNVEVQAFINYKSENPDTPFLVGTAMDITDRKRADEELKFAMMSANHASNAKSEFLASMSHDLRTPLNAILGFSEVLKEQYLGPLGTEKYREYANDIHDSGNYLLELVDQLLDLSAIEAGETQLRKEMVGIDEIVDDCIRTVAKKAETKGVDLTFVPTKTLPPACVDRRAIKQVVLNLLSNSIKFTMRGGAININTDRCDEGVCIVVTDNGVGISADQIADISSPFKRGKKDPHVAEKGWGLGLAISRPLIELHGGTFLIESELDKGTSVTITVPIDA